MPAIVNLSCALCENAINVCLEFPIYGVPRHWWHPRPIWSRNLISNICAIINLPGLRWVIKAHQLVKSWESGLGLTRLPITFLTTIVKFLMKVLCDSELEISSHFENSFYFLRSYPKVVSPLQCPFSATCVGVATVQKWLYKYQLYLFSSFFLLLQIFSANMENPASWHCEPHVVQI